MTVGLGMCVAVIGTWVVLPVALTGLAAMALAVAWLVLLVRGRRVEAGMTA